MRLKSQTVCKYGKTLLITANKDRVDPKNGKGAKNNRSVSKNFKHNHVETKLHQFHHSSSASGLKLVAAMSKGRGAAKLAATLAMDVPAWRMRPQQEDTVIESSLESGDRGQAATQWLPAVESGARAGDGNGSGSFDNMYEVHRGTTAWRRERRRSGPPLLPLRKGVRIG